MVYNRTILITYTEGRLAITARSRVKSNVLDFTVGKLQLSVQKPRSEHNNFGGSISPRLN